MALLERIRTPSQAHPDLCVEQTEPARTTGAALHRHNSNRSFESANYHLSLRGFALWDVIYPENTPLDQRAVSDLFDRHHLALFRYAYRYTRRRDLAEDIVQEVFLRVMKGRDSYHERQRETAWLFTIAHRLLVDRSRALARHPIGPLPPTEPSAPRSPETSLLLNEALAAVHDPDREAFLLKEIGGLTYEEIGFVCGITLDSVRSRVFRARLRLREWFSAPERIAR
jgi:RNA polymerase sigma-70 factor (ECF subfamily)